MLPSDRQSLKQRSFATLSRSEQDHAGKGFQIRQQKVGIKTLHTKHYQTMTFKLQGKNDVQYQKNAG
jgi:hypothetical protein